MSADASPVQGDRVPAVDLIGEVSIPQLGFGVFQVPPEDTAKTVTHALKAGYRSIDTARAYRNEAGVGEAIAASGLGRDGLFVTTKLWNSDQGRESAARALEASLERLKLDHVDLYLIHWPVPSRDLYVDSWQTLVDLQRQGLTRAVGVSNFQIAHLERAIAETGVTPAVNQIELHPRLQQVELREFHAEHGIVTEAWSPLAQGGVLEDSTIVAVARAHAKTPAQIVLRWHLQLGNVVIPKSVTPQRIEENFDLFDFELDDEQMLAIRGLDAGERTGPDPDSFVG